MERKRVRERERGISPESPFLRAKLTRGCLIATNCPHVYVFHTSREALTVFLLLLLLLSSSLRSSPKIPIRNYRARALQLLIKLRFGIINCGSIRSHFRAFPSPPRVLVPGGAGGGGGREGGGVLEKEASSGDFGVLHLIIGTRLKCQSASEMSEIVLRTSEIGVPRDGRRSVDRIALLSCSSRFRRSRGTARYIYVYIYIQVASTNRREK